MTTKRKISVRKILQVFITLLLTGACITAILSASSKQDDRKITEMKIHIKNRQYGFLDKDEVKRLILNNKTIDPFKTSVAKLNIHQMENIVNSNSWVNDAQVYVDNESVLHVNVTQRVPVARLFEQNGNSYYLDKSLKTLPLSDRYIHYTTVVTNVPVLSDDSASNSLRSQIATLVNFVEGNTFWKAQISQIIVTDDKMFEVVPVLGNHKILIGDTSRLQDKFDNLFVFYRRVLNQIGWDRYEILDVRFVGQVVALPALQWKAPTDKMMSNMNWVKSIVSTEPVEKKSVVMRSAPVLAASAATIVVKPPVKAETPKPAAVAVKDKTIEEKIIPKPVAKKTEPPKVLQAKKPVIKKIEPKKPKAEIKKKPTEVKKAEKKKTEIKKTEVKQTNNKEEPNTQNQKTPKYIYQGQ